MDMLNFPAAHNAVTDYWRSILEIEEQEKQRAYVFSNMGIRHGFLSRKPIESKYNAVRRFFSLNTAITSNELINYVRYSLEITGFIEASLQLEKKWLSKCFEGVAKDRSPRIRNCPECARCNYHSVLFQLPWFKICPIHESELEDTCPTCRLHWPNYRELMSRKCETCALRRNVKITDNIKHNDGTFSSLIVISKLLHSQPDYLPQYNDYCGKTFDCNSSKSSSKILRTIVNEHPGSERLIASVSTIIPNVTRKRIRVTGAPRAIDLNQHAFLQKESVNRKLKYEFLQLSKKHLKKSEEFVPYNVETFPPDRVFNPELMAISVILYLLEHSALGYTNARLDTLQLGRFIFSFSGIPLPTLITKIRAGKTLEIPFKATEFLYRLSWWKIFERICIYCKWIQEQKAYTFSSKSYEVDVPDTARFWLPRSIGIELRFEGRWLDVFYESNL